MSIDLGIFHVFSYQVAADQNIRKGSISDAPPRPKNESTMSKSEFVSELPTLVSPKAK